ncbi:MAG: DNA mismatch repair protein MutS [Treponema sp.]|jgi:DNA mismatch repair protein MutS|nr:DNA mismatch repair protein MutS [Treponema sp.]
MAHDLKSSPMLDQYRRIKSAHRDSVLFFRLGDFYEMFAEDAVEISALLNLTLTSRSGIPMCGVPYHAARSYIGRLLRHGKKVAVCEQLAEPGKAKLMERRVVEVITPGTTIDEYYLNQGVSNYLASLTRSGKRLSFSCIDLSAGAFFATSFPAEDVTLLALELERLEISEIILSESLIEENQAVAKLFADRPHLLVNRWADWLFDPVRGRDRLVRQFATTNLKAFGLDDDSPEIASAGALLDYLEDTAKSLLPHIVSISVYGENEYVEIDESSQRNLELVRNLRDGSEKFTLLEVLDETKTAMGRRILRRRILHPLRDLQAIERRLALTGSFYRDQEKLARCRETLAKTPDLERLSSRLAMDKANGKDMVSIAHALLSFASLWEFARERTGLFEASEALAFNEADFDALQTVSALLERGLAENPSLLLSEGNLIRDGYSAELDRLRMLKESGHALLESYLEEERAASDIASLKIRYNRLIGYYFEVTKTNLPKVPSYFIRRQGIAGGERYTTDRLAKLESEINGAFDSIIELEKKLFLELRESARRELSRLYAAGKITAELDIAQALARCATVRGWIKPLVNEEKRFAVIEGRHPVVEAYLPQGEFIPNDVILGDVYFALITGPNMAGKSTYLRQAALIAIMAQMGSFVPAAEASLGITDRIYCRVGASDNLARGESTFLVEMNETAHILRSATEKSLVIMDEVGRGTGTGDGLAIAWAICEDILHRIKCRTFFATHFHELALLSHPSLVNRSMEVLDNGGEIVFLRKLREGPSSESYGLHAASLAGIPPRVISRAQVILERLRVGERSIRGALPAAAETAGADALPAAREHPVTAGPSPPEHSAAAKLAAELAELDLNSLTPLEALNYLQLLKQRLQSAAGARKSAPRFPKKAEHTTETPSLFD